ncbi:MAG: Asp-tRNA(Asn)/Glu-tRNA(Gln) amidotransferase subunit GatC [Polyangiaceae bacterium]|nr:Asp-tRNA(Asn)/Glu-tRNA(Gln) amidotransferase subunit GatC [Polyangiaceae bacterium]
MAITKADVLHVAKLAHLTLEPGETEQIIVDMNKVLGYVALLSELDTSQVEPTTHVAVSHAPLRLDVLGPNLTRESFEGEAPRYSDQGFVVPGFVEG